MTVKAWLEGHPGDLATVARHFKTGDPAIGQHDDGNYYLTSVSFDDLWGSGSRLQLEASSLLTKVNGVARVLDPDFRPVKLLPRFSDDSGRGQIVVLAQAIESNIAFGIAVLINGVPQEPPPSPAPDFMQRLTAHPDAAEVVGILGKAGDAISWHDLYKVFEIVRDNVGNQQSLIGMGWKSKTDISAFTVSANSPSVSGDAARHARSNSGVPQHTMTLAEGRAMISELVRAWLGWLAPTA